MRAPLECRLGCGGGSPGHFAPDRVLQCAETRRGYGVGTSASALQVGYLGAQSNNAVGVNLLQLDSASRQGQSTGAIRAIWPNGNTGNCGVTFISHHYGMTAAHCVPVDAGFNIGSGTPFSVEQYDTTDMQWSAISGQSMVSGTWPNYFRAHRLGSSDGYYVYTYSGCTVARRCSAAYGHLGSENCPVVDDVDVAMVYCPTREGQWVPVATSDLQNNNVDVYWFHEVLNLSPDGADYPYEPVGNWGHYGSYDRTKQNRISK